MFGAQANIGTPVTHPHALLQHALQANSDHQYALKVYTQRLEAEIAHVDKLLVSIDCPSDSNRGLNSVAGRRVGCGRATRLGRRGKRN
jgi:hypothetical protein